MAFFSLYGMFSIYMACFQFIWHVFTLYGMISVYMAFFQFIWHFFSLYGMFCEKSEKKERKGKKVKKVKKCEKSETKKGGIGGEAPLLRAQRASGWGEAPQPPAGTRIKGR